MLEPKRDSEKFSISIDRLVSYFVRDKAKEDNRPISNWIETLVRRTYPEELEQYIKEHK